MVIKDIKNLNIEDITFTSLIADAIQITIKNEIENLKRGRIERNFTVRLSESISALLKLPNISSDPFYNKHLNATKRLNGHVIELDIAVHSQGTDENNFVAIELETTNSPKRDDVWKIKGLTNPLGGYGYKLGLYLVIGIEKKAGKILALDWYKNGKIMYYQ